MRSVLFSWNLLELEDVGMSFGFEKLKCLFYRFL